MDKPCWVCYGAIFKINPVMIEFTAFENNYIMNKKINIKAKKEKIIKYIDKEDIIKWK